MKKIDVAGILVEEVIFKTRFSCNYEDCHGACCNAPLDAPTDGGLLSPKEAAELRGRRSKLSEFCDEDCAAIVNGEPVYSEGGCLFTKLLGDKCVLCNTKEGSCAVKLANAQGVVSFDIPQSCGLYPLNIRSVSYRGRPRKLLELLHLFDRYCVSSYEKGERENVLLIEFMQPILVRVFGEKFYDKLWEVQRRYL